MMYKTGLYGRRCTKNKIDAVRSMFIQHGIRQNMINAAKSPISQHRSIQKQNRCNRISANPA
ncbi:MAG: hypothetical protein ACQEUT_15190 [Bacillota bacterium]